MLPRMTGLVDRLLPDELWRRVQPLLPPPPPRPRGGVPRRVPDLNCLAALIFMAAPAPLEPAAGQGMRTGAWLGGFRRLRIRYERSSERFYALAMLACAVICCNRLGQSPGS